MQSPRSLSLSVLTQQERDGSYINIALDSAAKKLESDKDRAFLALLVYGITEHKITLDYIISAITEKSADKLRPHTLMILRLGLYQIMYTDKVPDSAAVNESVKLCDNVGEKSFVNATLRAYLRNKKKYTLPPKEKNRIRHISVKYSFPPDLCRFFISIYGEEKTEEIFDWFNSDKKLTIFVNTMKISPKELKEKIEGAAISPFCDTAITVPSGSSVRSLYGFSQGLFFVEDLSSQIAVRALDAKEGMTVYDVCACPGGKSFGAQIYANNKAVLKSFDIHESKLSLIKSGAERLALDLTASVRDASKAYPDEEGICDRVICDVPCSGLGVLGKKPDMRYKDFSILSTLPPLQREIMDSASAYLKKGGIMVYSTCTVNPEENEENVKYFLSKHKDFSLVPFDAFGKMREGMYTVTPGENGADGFFIAKLIRNG